ncbi:MAG: copper chaperone PCu(A)C [Tateyamaria sp.]|nr:copper chaperone PCu(A)C [Tateyamaria sp.]
MFYRSLFIAALAVTIIAVPLWADSIKITEPYARVASPNSKSGAAFMMLENQTILNDRLLSARSNSAKRVELHTHVETGDGVMQMTEIKDGIELRPGVTHHLKRGADHIMLMGLTEPLRQDFAIDITLIFEKAGEIIVSVPIDNNRKPTETAHSH